jgi:hypothetical protein
VLVQATVAHAWSDPDLAKELDAQLRTLARTEPHRLVRAGIDLARTGLKVASSRERTSATLGSYIWVHERDAVRWVQQGKGAVARLAADTVLLSNMLYRLRLEDADKADDVAVRESLPPCIAQSQDRHEISEGCSCPHGLCAAKSKTPPIEFPRAPFSALFCREQSRLVQVHGPPPWAARRTLASLWRRRHLADFWEGQAEIAQTNGDRKAV